MRLLIRLRARAGTAYDARYHHKLRGRIWRALEGTDYDDEHDSEDPTGLCYSNPFPPYDMEEGDNRTLLISGTDRGLLGAIAADLDETPELNIGEMPFEVTDLSLLVPDVGEPGTHGVLETGTGVLVRLNPRRCREFGIETDGENPTFWRPEHTMAPFMARIEEALDKKHNHLCPNDLPGPTDRDTDLFHSYELIKTFALPVTVTQGVEMTYILSKWRLGYEVQDDHHRRHLNLALDTGIGDRNTLGLGFLNIDEESVERPGQRVDVAVSNGGRKR